MANESAITGPMAAMVAIAGGEGASVGLTKALQLEVGGFNVAEEAGKAVLQGRAATLPGATATALAVVSAMDARYMMRERQVAVVEAADYTAALNDDFIDVEYTATGAVSIVLPTASLTGKRSLRVIDGAGNAGTNNITISTEGDEKIGAADTYVMNTNGAKVTLIAVPSKNKWLVG